MMQQQRPEDTEDCQAASTSSQNNLMTMAPPTSVSAAASGDSLKIEVLKIHQWKVSTKMELEAKESRLQVSMETIAQQESALAKVHSDNEDLERRLAAKEDELKRVTSEMEAKTATCEMVEASIGHLKKSVEKQEKVLATNELQNKIVEKKFDELAEKCQKIGESHVSLISNRYFASPLKRRPFRSFQVAERDALKARIEKETAMTAKLAKAEKELKVEILTLGEELTRLEREKDHLSNMLEERQEAIDGLKMDVADKEDKMAQREREVDNYKSLLKREREERDEQIQALQDECCALDARNDKVKKEMDEVVEKWTEKAGELGKEKDAAMVEVANYKEKTAEMKKELKQGAKEREGLEKSLRDAEHCLAKERQEKQEALGGLEESKTRNVALERDLADLTGYEVELKMLRADFNAELEETKKLREQNTMLEGKVAQLTKVNVLNEERISKLNDEKQSASSAADANLAERQETIDSLKIVILTKEAEISKLETSMEYLVQEHEGDLTKAHNYKDDQLKKREETIKKLEKQLEEAKTAAANAAKKKDPPSAKKDATPSSKSRSSATKDKGPISINAPAGGEARKRRILEDDSDTTEEGNLFDQFFSKTAPKKTFERKTPKRKFFKHVKAPTEFL